MGGVSMGAWRCRKFAFHARYRYGVDVLGEEAADMEELGVCDPFQVKRQQLIAATEVASLILSIDQTIILPPRVE